MAGADSRRLESAPAEDLIDRRAAIRKGEVVHVDTADWRIAINLILDLAAYYLELLSWVCFIWLPLATAFMMHQFDVYLRVLAMLVLVMLGSLATWMSEGIYERRRGRMLMLALISFAFYGWVPNTYILKRFVSFSFLRWSGPSPLNFILCGVAWSALVIGLAKGESLEERSR